MATTNVDLNKYKVEVSERVQKMYDLEDIAIFKMNLSYSDIKKFHNIDPQYLIRIGEELVRTQFNGDLIKAYKEIVENRKK